MKRNIMKSLISVAVLLVLIAGGGLAEAGDRRFGSLAPSGSAWMNILEQGARKLEAGTDGRIKTKFYAGGSQGDEKDMVRKLKLKQLDAAALTSVGLSIIYPGIRVLQLPFLFSSVEEIDYVRGKLWPYFQAKFKASGYHLMAPGDVGWTYLYSRTPLKSKADVSKVKMWAWADDPIVRAFFNRLNINSVPLGVPDVLPALKTNRIDGCYGSPLAAVALQWYTEVTYATSRPVAYGVGGMVVRSEAFESSTAADQKLETKLAKKTGKALLKRVRKDNKRALKAMKKSGIKVIETPAAMEKALRADAEKIWQELVGKVYTQEELDMVLKARAEFRAKI